MEKKDIIAFFDRCAPSWDAGMVKSDKIIGTILDNAEVGEGMDVLDVACGTGVMFDPYFEVEVMISNDRMYQLSGVKRDPLAHSHDGAVTHSHNGLTHSHVHGEEEHTHVLDENATPLEELLVMMKYLVSHNDAHAQEVADLARNLQGLGKIAVYDEIMDAVSDFDMVNAKLAAIAQQLSCESDDDEYGI